MYLDGKWKMENGEWRVENWLQVLALPQGLTDGNYIDTDSARISTNRTN